MFMQLFAPDKSRVARKNITESLKTADGGLAYFERDAALLNEQGAPRVLINKKARVLKGDIEGKYSVIQVIDTVLIP